MAHVKKNLVTKGLSGILGGTLVFRNVGEKTVVAVAPSTTKEASPAQKNQREKFQQAVFYAKAQMADPVTKAEYESHTGETGGPSAYNIAVADFFSAPDIVEIDLSKYLGKKGDTIRIRVTDDFKVKSVGVEISNDKGTEKGNAVMQDNKLDWVYTTTEDNASVVGNKIVVKAYDMPGNETKEEKTL